MLQRGAISILRLQNPRSQLFIMLTLRDGLDGSVMVVKV